MPGFKIFNLIYGWNYSGKTLLSRVFRWLEKGKLHNDYLMVTFELKSTTAKHDYKFAFCRYYRVLNPDILKDNL